MHSALWVTLDPQWKELRWPARTSQDIDAYTKDATSSDYNHLLVVSCEMIDKVNEVLGLNEYDEDEDYEDEDY